MWQQCDLVLPEGPDSEGEPPTEISVRQLLPKHDLGHINRCETDYSVLGKKLNLWKGRECEWCWQLRESPGDNTKVACREVPRLTIHWAEAFWGGSGVTQRLKLTEMTARQQSSNNACSGHEVTLSSSLPWGAAFPAWPPCPTLLPGPWARFRKRLLAPCLRICSQETQSQERRCTPPPATMGLSRLRNRQNKIPLLPPSFILQGSSQHGFIPQRRKAKQPRRAVPYHHMRPKQHSCVAPKWEEKEKEKETFKFYVI